jgi:hypothetical protein
VPDDQPASAVRGSGGGDIRINRPAIKVRPAEDGDEDVAEIRQGLIRAIEQQSNAQMVYAQAGRCRRLAASATSARPEYAGDETFDRDITISLIPDPLAVVWDPLSRRADRQGRSLLLRH